MEMPSILLFLSPFLYVLSLGRLLDSKLSTRAYFRIRPTSLVYDSSSSFKFFPCIS